MVADYLSGGLNTVCSVKAHKFALWGEHSGSRGDIAEDCINVACLVRNHALRQKSTLLVIDIGLRLCHLLLNIALHVRNKDTGVFSVRNIDKPLFCRNIDSHRLFEDSLGTVGHGKPVINTLSAAEVLIGDNYAVIACIRDIQQSIAVKEDIARTVESSNAEINARDSPIGKIACL